MYEKFIYVSFAYSHSILHTSHYLKVCVMKYATYIFINYWLRKYTIGIRNNCLKI